MHEPASSRLIFRVPLRGDLEALRATGLGMPRDPSARDAEGWLETVLAHHRRHGYGYWSLDVPDAEECVGFAGLDHRGADGDWLGYAIHPSHRGRGLATEAAHAVIRWAVERGVEPLFASVRPPNPASERVLEHVGLILAATTEDAQGARLVFVLAAGKAEGVT